MIKYDTVSFITSHVVFKIFVQALLELLQQLFRNCKKISSRRFSATDQIQLFVNG